MDPFITLPSFTRAGLGFARCTATMQLWWCLDRLVAVWSILETAMSWQVYSPITLLNVD